MRREFRAGTGTQSSHERQVNYLLDENVPPYLTRAIAALHARDYPDDSVLSPRDVGSQGQEDETWIASLIASGEPWTVVGRDLMRKEWSLLQSSELTWFVLNKGWASVEFWDLSSKLVKAWPNIVAAGLRSPGMVFNVALSGKVQLSR